MWLQCSMLLELWLSKHPMGMRQFLFSSCLSNLRYLKSKWNAKRKKSKCNSEERPVMKDIIPMHGTALPPADKAWNNTSMLTLSVGIARLADSKPPIGMSVQVTCECVCIYMIVCVCVPCDGQVNKVYCHLLPNNPPPWQKWLTWRITFINNIYFIYFVVYSSFFHNKQDQTRIKGKIEL